MALKLKDIVAGNTRRIELTFYTADGVLADLAGASTALTAKLEGSDAAAIQLTSAANPSQFAAVSTGVIRITLSSANTALTPGTYNFGAQATLVDGTVLEDTGTFKVKTQYVT